MATHEITLTLPEYYDASALRDCARDARHNGHTNFADALEREAERLDPKILADEPTAVGTIIERVNPNGTARFIAIATGNLGDVEQRWVRIFTTQAGRLGNVLRFDDIQQAVRADRGTLKIVEAGR